MDEGMQIDWSDEQPEKADSPIRLSLGPDSNVTIASEVDDEKHSLGRMLTEAGTQIDFSDGKYENADSAMRSSCEPNSNTRFSPKRIF
jgi:hypothetical protein